MAELQRHFLVFDQTKDKVLALFDFEREARAFATDHAERNLGNTIVVFEPKEAFRASAHVSKVYLEFPTRAEDRPPAEKMPPQTPPEYIENNREAETASPIEF